MKFISATSIQLNTFYKANNDKARAKPGDLMFAALDEHDQLCAVLRFLPYSNFLFLRSVFTQHSARGQGIASKLIQFSINDLACSLHNNETITIYTLPTPKAQSLYLRIGFHQISQPKIPNELSASYRRFRHTNSESGVMVLHI